LSLIYNEEGLDNDQLGFGPVNTMEHDLILEVDGLLEVLVARNKPGSFVLRMIGFASFLELQFILTRY